MKARGFIINTLKGFSMGAGVFPGVSAGTVALMTGIFRPLIASLAAMLSVENWKKLFKGDAKAFWKAINGEFLVPVGIGMVLGFLILARLVGWSLGHWPIQTWAFFFGLILVSTVWLLADMKGWKAVDVLWLLLGIGAGLALCLVKHPDQNNPNTALWYTALSGALAVCSMILPGIAGSFILVMMGNFNFMLEVLNGSVSHLLGGAGTPQWGQLLVFTLGCALGIVAFSKALNALLEKHGRPTLLVLFGFVLGFLYAIWPWNGNTSSDLQIPSAVLFFLLGGAAVAALQLFTKKEKEQ